MTIPSVMEGSISAGTTLEVPDYLVGRYKGTLVAKVPATAMRKITRVYLFADFTKVRRRF